ncbi:MAG: hypothetical protein ABI861_02855 [Panacibacter sp.]
MVFTVCKTIISGGKIYTKKGDDELTYKQNLICLLKPGMIGIVHAFTIYFVFFAAMHTKCTSVRRNEV